MMATTHIAAGAASAALAAASLSASGPQLVLMLGGGVLGSLLPDIDHPQSSFGRRVLPVSMTLAAIFGHRGITHSLLAVAGVSWLIWYAMSAMSVHPGLYVPFAIGLGVGYLSHLAGDWMTNSGVPLLWPSKRRFVSPIRIFTGDAIEYLVAAGIYAWMIIYFVRRFSNV